MHRKFEFKEEVFGVVLAFSLLAFQNCAKPNDISNGDSSSSAVTMPNAPKSVWPGTTDANGVILISVPSSVSSTSTNSGTTCVNNGATYDEAATSYGDPCPGLSCPGDIGPLLTCHSGYWSYSNGADLCAAGVPSNYANQAQGVVYLRAMGCSI